MMEREGRTSISGVAWETLWEQASGPMVLLDLQGRVEQANPALCRMLGYAEEELIGLASGDVTYTEDPVIDREVIEQKVRDGTRSFAQGYDVYVRTSDQAGEMVLRQNRSCEVFASHNAASYKVLTATR